MIRVLGSAQAARGVRRREQRRWAESKGAAGGISKSIRTTPDRPRPCWSTTACGAGGEGHLHSDWKSLERGDQGGWPAITSGDRSLPVLTPLAGWIPVTRFRSCPTCRVMVWKPATRRPRSGSSRRIKVPEILPRLHPARMLRSRPGDALGLGDVADVNQFSAPRKLIAANLDALFPGMDILGTYAFFRVTRDMDSTSWRTRSTTSCRSSDRGIPPQFVRRLRASGGGAGIPDGFGAGSSRLEIDDDDWSNL